MMESSQSSFVRHSSSSFMSRYVCEMPVQSNFVTHTESHSFSPSLSGSEVWLDMQDEREHPEMCAPSLFDHPTASPKTTTTPRYAILRSVDRNSPHFSALENKEKANYRTTPQKPQTQNFRSWSSPHERKSETSMDESLRPTNFPSSPASPCTPNSVDFAMITSPPRREEPFERPQCVNPVSLTLWRLESSESCVASPAPIAGAPSSSAKLLRPTARRRVNSDPLLWMSHQQELSTMLTTSSSSVYWCKIVILTNHLPCLFNHTPWFVSRQNDPLVFKLFFVNFSLKSCHFRMYRTYHMTRLWPFSGFYMDHLRSAFILCRLYVLSAVDGEDLDASFVVP